ncbi:hypothetical protein HYS91_02415 [Candidatus Daviesbacteria bacterium]|nr:hypothetical protein [Candidatus Daviesbacteria bacterium]
MKDSVSNWFLFVGTVLFLIGLFAALKTAANFTLFTQYPTGSAVVPLNISGIPPYYGQREEDCQIPYSAYYPATDQVPSEEFQKEQQKKDQESCLRVVKRERENAKINDISQAAFYLFLGAGLLATRKLLLK